MRNRNKEELSWWGSFSVNGEVKAFMEAKTKVFEENQVIELLSTVFRLYFNVFFMF